jgi:hypothetical protein
MSRASAPVSALLFCWGCETLETPCPIAAPISSSATHRATVLYVIGATYGGNCGAFWGNVTEPLAKACNGLPACDYRVDYRVIGDPAIGCGKDFVVEWRCSDGTDVYQAFAPPEAGYGAFVRMMCDETRRRAPANPGALVEVVSATYGGNCAAPRGNETADLARACSGKPECQYRIDYTIIGDPAVGCGKDYVAEWRCSGSRVTRQTKAAPEAGYGAVITLRCAQP